MIPFNAKLPAIFKSRSRRAAVAARVRPPSSPHHQYFNNNIGSNHESSFLKLDNNSSSHFSSKGSTEMNFNDIILDHAHESISSNRVMVVVDSSLEAKAALQWALSHTLQPHDTIILLHIISSSPSNHAAGVNSSPSNHKAYQLLYSLKNACQITRPGVEVEIAVRHGKEKPPVIVEEAKQRKVSLLVLGQKRRPSSIMWRLQKLWKLGKRRRGNHPRRGVVEYCIQNANCLTIAVRRKGRKHGGYLITTKRHKNFWLLA